jgi:hypothetical protein
VKLALGALLVVTMVACLRTPSYQCQTSAQCGTDGRCEGNSFCSVPDPGCASGHRWGAGSPESGQCVGADVADAQPADAAPGRPVNVCLVQAKRSPNDSACVADVCAAMPRCCTREWSDQCVQLAETRCQTPCGTVLATIGKGRVRVLKWNGAGYAPLWSKATFTNDSYAGIAWGDVDGDLKPDLATCEGHVETGTMAPGRLCIWTNGGGCGEAFCELKCIDVGDCQRVAWIDADGDGDQDVIATGAYVSYLWLQDQGLFASTPDGAPLGMNIVPDFDWADLDGDGVLDVALAGYDTPVRVARVTVGGDEKLTLMETWNDDSAARHRQVGFGDVDGDGALDLYVTGDDLVHVWKNTSSTTFTASAPPYFDHPGFSVSGAAFADVDEDGDLDLVVTADASNVAVLRNNNRGPQPSATFTQTPAWQSVETFGDARIAIGDVDGDHHLDVVVGAVPATPAAATSVYLARPAEPGKLGKASPKDTASWVDPDAATVRGVALTGSW